MSKKINRRGFLKNSVLASAGAIVGLGFEERGLLAAQRRGSAPEKPKGVMPKGKIGKVEMSRLIIGGNVLGGGAHARDLMYVSRLMRAYNTTEKVMECLQLAEENGIDMNFDGGRRITNYNKERGGKMRWMAQVHPKADDLTSASQRAIDQGAIGAYLWGAQADRWVQTNRLDLIDGFVSFLKKNGLLAGVGGVGETGKVLEIRHLAQERFEGDLGRGMRGAGQEHRAQQRNEGSAEHGGVLPWVSVAGLAPARVGRGDGTILTRRGTKVNREMGAWIAARPAQALRLAGGGVAPVRGLTCSGT